MKKYKWLGVFLVSFFIGIFSVQASSNKLYDLKINITIDQNGTAWIEEIWNMKVAEGTEVYKPMGNLGASVLDQFSVSDESGVQYEDISWNVNASFNAKRHKSGIHYTSSGLELCWGMGSYGGHIYTLKYRVTNFVSNVSDGQMIYWKLVNDSMNPAPQHVSVIITSEIPLEDTTPVWGYGYKGYAYVENGKIYLESERGISSSEYMVLLAKFEPRTFDVENTLTGDFNSWYNQAQQGTFEHDYYDGQEQKTGFTEVVVLLISLFPMLMIIFVVLVISKSADKYDFGVKGKINYKELNYFRDIPCKKDIFRAYYIANLYNLNKKKEDFLGTILLKWLESEKIAITETPKKKLKKQKYSIDLKSNDQKNFASDFEQQLFDMLMEASKDGILESKEFDKWCGNHYNKILNWFDKVLAQEKKRLIEDGSIIIETEKSMKIFSRRKFVMQPKLQEEAEQLAGLKKFLIDFSDMKNKEVIEVHLWKEYLMFAQIFGIADKVAKQFKQLYPDLITDFNYDGIIMINALAYSGIHRAASARSSAESYSSGGGGFSSGGGGGGSFGGGSGGGCR